MRQSLISDDLLRQLIAVGQVDVIVGLPTHNNASSVTDVVRAVHQGFGKYLARERTALINLDGGSDDGTPELVRAASPEEGVAVERQHLRTAHRVTAPYHGVPGKRAGLRTLFAAADLLQAKAVAVLAPDVTSVTPEWVASLVRPVLRGDAEFVSPVFSRHPLDAPLVTQLVRPVVHAAYGQLIREPLAGEFGCSPRFAAHCLAEPVWEGELGTAGIDIWLTAAALAGRFPIAQPVLGPRIQAAGGVKPSLPELFQQVVGALFTCLELHESFWLARQDESVDCRVSSLDGQGATVPTMDVARAVETFRRDAKSLLPVLDRVVTPSTLEALRGLVEVNAEPFRYPDTLWVDTVYEFAASHHRGAIHRQHVMQAFVPLYLGRVAAFFLEHSTAAAPLVDEQLDRLCRQFDSARGTLAGRWTETG